ncbi:AAA family ATPase [Actinomadura sp. J1-007]|uniref:AAA family ATPase n=1 Tax=Actinomadura sp. J1-007 TaxID=2661913 RepID=UPI001F4F4268|nr:AAA family ATPase [Actinomadura sp. J1-007]
MVFTGNPGTAKTTIARLLASVYARLGLLSSGHLVEVTRADLVAEYVGQTAPKVRAAVDRALGGVLFVDEAYALAGAHAPGGDFGREAVAELLRLMEEHRSDLVVIVAGYDREMEEFLSSNPGLASRFPRVLRFPDYADDELVAIFEAMAADAGYRVDPEALDAVRAAARRPRRGPHFGNAREMRNLLDRAVAVQAQRITSSPAAVDDEEVRTLRPSDLHAATTDPDKNAPAPTTPAPTPRPAPTSDRPSGTRRAGRAERCVAFRRWGVRPPVESQGRRAARRRLSPRCQRVPVSVKPASRSALTCVDSRIDSEPWCAAAESSRSSRSRARDGSSAIASHHSRQSSGRPPAKTRSASRRCSSRSRRARPGRCPRP